MKRTATLANAGAKSIRPVVRLRGKPCSLKRHFKGCLRQVIGYLDLLAANDPERFVWPSVADIQRHTPRWKTGVTYSRWQIFFWLREAKNLGVLTSAIRTRRGLPRQGFIVTSHDALMPAVIPDSSGCVLDFKPHCDQCQTTLQTTLNSRSDHTPNHTLNHTEKSPQAPENESGSQDTDAVLDQTLDEVRRALTLSALSCQPCKENPEKIEPLLNKGIYLGERSPENEIAEKPANGKTPTSPISSVQADLTDQTQTRGQGKSERTIGDEILIEYSTGTEIIDAITDGEFDTEALASYRSTDDLIHSCLQAHAEMAGQPFLGRKSYAAVMGRAMKMLREKHDADAPRGWVPVMKQLRASTANPATKPHSVSDAFNVDPSEVLTSPTSAIRGFWSQDADALESERRNNPMLSEIVIETAKRMGVPKGWIDGLQYADAVIAELQRQNQPVPEPLVSIQVKLRDRVSPVATSPVSKSRQDADAAA